MDTSKTFRLKDGRRLSYIEYGDPKGKPVFFFLKLIIFIFNPRKSLYTYFLLIFI